jgi:hypothetical protein
VRGFVAFFAAALMNAPTMRGQASIADARGMASSFSNADQPPKTAESTSA